MAGNVLVVDGNPKSASDIVSSLVDAGYTAFTAADPIQALPLARRERPDLVLVDETLPGGGGLVLLQRLRANLATAVTPVIVMSTSQESRQKCIDAGAQEVVPKASSHAGLLSVVDRLIGTSAAVNGAPRDVIEDAERMRALEDTALLGSPPEEEFDRFTRLASRILGAPVALMSLVSRDRQFFKSSEGLPEPWASRRETPLSHSFCQFVVTFREPVVIENARTHPLVERNLAIEDLSVVAYAGVPLITDDGQAIGSFCAIDSKPRQWKDEDIETLRDLAAILMAQVQLRRALAMRHS